MPRELLHVYGPFSINSYGTTIACALLIFLYLINRYPLKKRLFPKVDMLQPLIVGTIIGIIGGRTLFVLSNLDTMETIIDYIAIWCGGFSVLGAIGAIVIFFPIYLRSLNIAILPFFDIIAIHAPLLQSISRLGCFFAGCCYGKVFHGPYSVIYTTHNTCAPQNICLYPTQLYSAFSLLLIFAFMYFIAPRLCWKEGQITCVYLILASASRFTVDFWRGDQEFFALNHTNMLSINQWICLGIITAAIIGFIYFAFYSKPMRARNGHI